MALILLVGCSTTYDAGSTPREQLCDLLDPLLDRVGPAEAFALEPLIEGAAADPHDLSSELLAIALAYRTNEGAYDGLSDYEPAIRFTAALVELAQDGLIGTSELSPTVLESALAVDAALSQGACSG